MNRQIFLLLLSFFFSVYAQAQVSTKGLTKFVNPFLGTATLWDSSELGYQPTHRAWGGEVFPGASLPNAMVQATPVTHWRSGSGYQYEDTVIYAFAHTSKGHWNLLYAPFLGVSGKISPEKYYTKYSHDKESASPGYYQVFLEKYNINAELTTTLHCTFHKYTYGDDREKELLAPLSMANEHVSDWNLEKIDEYTFVGFQKTGKTFYFYGKTNLPIKDIEKIGQKENSSSLIHFKEGQTAGNILTLKMGFSYVSEKNAKENFQREIEGKAFRQVRKEANQIWENLLSHVRVEGGTSRNTSIFYSTLYRSFLWPILLSDVNGDYVDENREVVNHGFRYYSLPSFWDTYRNKLILLGMITPDVALDVIKSVVDRGKITGYMPTFFHGDHASAFIAGSYLRGINNFDVKEAYNILLNNAFKPGKGGRPYLKEYMERGWISEMDISDPDLETKAKAAVTKTQEYAYDDYATALLAKVLGDKKHYTALMKRTKSYVHLFDPQTQLMRGRLAGGKWITPFYPKKPYYEYMYREANAWQSTFFAPHNPEVLVNLFPNHKAFENKLDSLFTIPWGGYEAYNLTTFIGQYTQGNQPDHSAPYFYYFIGKQEKSQAILNRILEKYYGMGSHGLAYSGMDDAGEMSAWYVLNAIGLYTFSPADPAYLVTIPIFKKTTFNLRGTDFKIERRGSGLKIKNIEFNQKKINGYFVKDSMLATGGTLRIIAEDAD